MKTKSVLLATAVFLTVGGTTAYAQKGELAKAKKSYTSYSTLSGGAFTNLPELATKELENAKIAIAKAEANDKTKELGDTWFVSAAVYADNALMLQQSKGNADSANIFYTHAKESLAKAKAAEGKISGDVSQLNNRTELLLAYYQQSRGITYFQERDYNAATNAWKEALSYQFVNPELKNSLGYFLGLAAQSNKDYDTAIKSFSALIEENKSLPDSSKYDGLADAYVGLSESYLGKEDTAAAIKAIDDAYVAYPDSSKIAENRVIKYLNANRGSEIIGDMEKQVAANPNNGNYPFYLGLAYEGNKQPEKALQAYEKGIKAEPNAARNYGNAGVVILNESNRIITSAGSLQKQEEYDAEIAKAVANAEKALPYLQKAVDLEPTSRGYLSNLRAYYQIKSDEAKVTELTKKIDEL